MTGVYHISESGTVTYITSCHMDTRDSRERPTGCCTPCRTCLKLLRASFDVTAEQRHTSGFAPSSGSYNPLATFK